MSAKTEQKTEAPKFRPSKLVADALGESGEELALEQHENESELDFAIRCIEVLLATATDRSETIVIVGTTFAVEPEVKSYIVALLGEIASAKASLRAQKGAATRARNQIEEMEEAAKPRKLGPVELDGEPYGAEDLRELFDAAEEVVLAFSDGRDELRGIAPRKVDPSMFRLTRERLIFTEKEMLITGPGGDGPAPQLAGIALLTDGEQVAWCPLPKPIDVGAGQSLNLAGSVFFE